MQVVTVLTDLEHKGFRKFLQPSCGYYDLQLVVLQQEKNENYVGHRLKDILLRQFLEEIYEDEVILFTDGHDTVLLAGESEIMLKYASFQAPLVFSAEINCWPTKNLISCYPKSTHHFKFLNSGGFIGKAGFIKQMYMKNPVFDPKLDPAFRWSNQFFWHHVYLANSDKIRLDHECKLFYNTSTSVDKLIGINTSKQNQLLHDLLAEERSRIQGEIEFVGSKIKTRITNTYPCHLHFPGPIPKLLMEEQYFSPIEPWK